MKASQKYRFSSNTSFFGVFISAIDKAIGFL